MAAVALIVYGAGIGLESIARGTLPLAMFGAAHYPAVMGRIARPSLVAQAIAPSVAAMAIEFVGIDIGLGAVAIVAAANLGASLALCLVLRQTERSAATRST
jgi:hypothetical protein